MNRERAETYLRLLAEAELRGTALLVPGPVPGPGPVGGPLVAVPVALTRAAWALTAVGALDLQTAEAILADAQQAWAVRHRPAVLGSGAPRLGPRHFGGSGPPLARMSHLMPGLPGPATASGPAPPGGPDRYVPVGQMILFHDELISGELDVMSYAHTGAGARFTATWRARDLLGSRHHGAPPVEAITVADDRGQRYHLGFAIQGRPESTCDLILRPEPPPDIGWLDITAPGEQAVRVDLSRRAERPEPQISEISLSAGEHLLNRIAERILTKAPDHPTDWSRSPVLNPAAGLGATIGALEAAGALPADSAVPARLAALCASLGIGDHGITAAPAPDLPEPWLSMVTHYHRRKPETAPAGDGFAAVAAALPELEGIRLVLLGLHNFDGGTWMDALALGQVPGLQHRALGLDMAFPLSLWVRDGARRWHAARPAGWYHEDGEAALTLRLTPPLTRSCAWLDVLATGQSAQVRATVPLSWGYPW
jgi:hypothetical protein